MQKIKGKFIEKKLEHFKGICKKHKIKLTPQRLLVYEELIKTDEHPSTDMLYQKIRTTFPTISFDTVNRTLLTFHKIGLATLVEGTGNPKRFDGNPQKHHHFQCVKCRKIFDVFHEPYDNLQVPPELQEQFHIFRTNVHLEGLCNTCRNETTLRSAEAQL